MDRAEMAVRAFVTLLIAAVLLGGCAAKPGAEETTANATNISQGSNAVTRESKPALPASEEYERAVADFTNCVHDHTANLAACEKQRAIMERLGKVSSRSLNQSYTLGNTQIIRNNTGTAQPVNSANPAQATSSQPPAPTTQPPQGSSQSSGPMSGPMSLTPPPATSQ
jgi:hypothetical protein